MSKDVSIVFKATDRMSESLTKMKDNVNGLTKDIEKCQKEQERLSKQKADIKLDITKAQKAMKDLTQDVKKSVAGSEEAFKKQQMALDRLGGEYKRLNQEQSKLFREESKLEKEKQKSLEGISKAYKEMTENVKDASKAEKQLSADISRSSNANASRSSGLMKGLATAGLGNMLSGAATNYLNTTVTSVFGSTTGGMISNIGGSALSGAAMGSIAGPIGSAVGAAVGGLTGAINALSEKQTKQDDLFRNEVQGLYNDAILEMDNRKDVGSAIAAEREMYRRQFINQAGEEAGDRLYREIKDYGDKTAYDTTAMLSKGLEMLTNNVQQEKVVDMMKMVGDIAMGDNNKFSGLSYAIAQSINADRVTGADVRQMASWGFNPLQFIAKDKGISTSQASELVTAGKVNADMLVDAMRLATSEGERFYNTANAISDTFTGMQGQLESIQNDFNAAMGEGYNETRKFGMEDEMERMNGELGDRMQEAYRMVGAYEAELENQRQQLYLDSMENAMKQIEEQGLSGVEAERVVWEAKTDAEIAYKNTEEYEKRKKAEQDLVEKIQEEMIAGKDYLKYGIAMGEQFSKGYSGAVRDAIGSGALSGATADKAVKNHGNAGQKLWNHVNNAWKQSAVSHPHATGLDRVPYDGYHAILHEGEQVLTRVEADQQRNGFGGVQIAKLADSIVVREEADIDRIATTIVRKLSAAAESYA